MGKPLKLAEIDVVVFDLDGTVYYGPNIIPGANETIRALRQLGVQVFFATNNSTKSRKQIFERLRDMGVDCGLDEVLTSGYLAAQYARKHKMKDVYIFGSVNLADEFEEAGVRVTRDEGAENMLIGYDPAMTYEGLASAVRVAMQARCVMACNRERTYPGKDARLMPGCGAMVAPVEWCSGRECDVVIGKPNPLMMEYISKHFDVNVARILMVGDTYDSDVRMAFLAGCQAVHVSQARAGDVPTVASVAGLLDLMEAAPLPEDGVEYREADSLGDVVRAWDALGDTHCVPLREQVDDVASYAAKLHERGTTYVATCGGAAVGSVSFYANDEGGRMGYISYLAVAPKFRRRGIGTELVERACAHARGCGMRAMRVDVPRASDVAIAMITACGFKLQPGKGLDEAMVRGL